MDKNKKHFGMVLAEVLFALFLCGIILALSICMFKSNDVSKTPHIYSVFKNIPAANKIIINECHNDGSCQNPSLLPDSVQEYCTRLADNFVTSKKVDCTNNNNSITINGTSYRKNFTLTNGVSFFDITKDNWDNSTTPPNNYIDAFIGVGTRPDTQKVLGIDLFPIRIFKNGEIVPGVSGTIRSYDDEEFFSYRAIVNHALDDNNRNSRVKGIIDSRTTTDKTNNIQPVDRFSFRDAICLTNPDLLERYYTGVTCDAAVSQSASCIFTGANASKNPYINDKSAFCTVEPVKPKGSGIFKIFGI